VFFAGTWAKSFFLIMGMIFETVAQMQVKQTKAIVAVIKLYIFSISGLEASFVG